MRGSRYPVLHGPQTRYWSPYANYRPDQRRYFDSQNPFTGISVDYTYSFTSGGTPVSKTVNGSGTFAFERVEYTGPGYCFGGAPFDTSAIDGTPGAFYALSTPCCPNSPRLIFGSNPGNVNNPAAITKTSFFTEVLTVPSPTVTKYADCSISITFLFGSIACRSQIPLITKTSVASPIVSVAVVVAGSDTANAQQSVTISGDGGSFERNCILPDGSEYLLEFDSGNASFRPEDTPDLVFTDLDNGLLIGFRGKYAAQAIPEITLITPMTTDDTAYTIAEASDGVTLSVRMTPGVYTADGTGGPGTPSGSDSIYPAALSTSGILSGDFTGSYSYSDTNTTISVEVS